ncbi:MAG: phosphoribosyltransferase, partial [Acidimicrobiia bacterium]|nr:phosphoribosyltransferase [Acidimicrobiia bacterium]
VRFADRVEAGHRLGEALVERAVGGEGSVVLGIPRGGVVIGAEVARVLGLPLDVALAHKVGAPGNPELAIGAVGPDGTAVIDEALARRVGATDAWLADAVEREQHEVADRQRRFRGDRPPLDVADREAIVVDDGVATGSTAIAVGRWLAGAGARRRILAVPVGPPQTADRLAHAYDDILVLASPQAFFAVGEFYVDFRQVTDDEVRELLAP